MTTARGSKAGSSDGSTGVAAALGWFAAAVFIAFMPAGIAGDVRAAGREQRV